MSGQDLLGESAQFGLGSAGAVPSLDWDQWGSVQFGLGPAGTQCPVWAGTCCDSAQFGLVPGSPGFPGQRGDPDPYGSFPRVIPRDLPGNSPPAELPFSQREARGSSCSARDSPGWAPAGQSEP